MLTINTLPSETETFIDAININYLFPHSFDWTSSWLFHSILSLTSLVDADCEFMFSDPADQSQFEPQLDSNLEISHSSSDANLSV